MKAVDEDNAGVIDLADRLSISAAKSLMKSPSVYLRALPDPSTKAVSFFNELVSGRKRKIRMMRPPQGRLAAAYETANDWFKDPTGQDIRDGGF
jgi:hypothetical protein